MQFFLQYQKLIFRIFGVFLLLLGLIVHFWIVPKEGVSQNALASANVARMEASVKGVGGSASSRPQSKKSPFLEKFEVTKKKQIEYLTIIVILLGSLALIYSFFSKSGSSQ